MTFLRWLRVVLTKDRDYWSGYMWVTERRADGMSDDDIFSLFFDLDHDLFPPSFGEAVGDMYRDSQRKETKR